MSNTTTTGENNMSTTTAKTVTPELIAHIKAYNAEKTAWVAEDPDDRFAFLVCDEAAHWAGYDVYTVEEYEMYMARAGLYDYYKDANGFRPSWAWVCSLTLDEISAEMDSLEVIVIESIKQDERWELEDAWNDAEETGDFSRFNDEIASNLTTEQAPIGSLGLIFS